MDRKYELTGISMNVDGATLHRIRALKDFELFDGYKVHKGELGGWIESEWNLDQRGNCWVRDNAIVRDYALVRDNAIVRDYATVYGNAVVGGSAKVCGEALMCGDILMCGCAVVFDGSYNHDVMYETSIDKIENDFEIE